MKYIGALVGLVLGAVAGFFGMFGMAQVYVSGGGDETAAGAFSFFTVLTIPAGAVIGALIGYSAFKKEKSEYRKSVMKKYEVEKR